MIHYPHYIGDFNNSTRHCSRLERSIFRDCLDMYFHKEAPLTENFDQLARLLVVNSEEERKALEIVLEDFFTLEADGYHNRRCDTEIAKYHGFIHKQAKAGRASAKARREKSTKTELALNGDATSVEPALNSGATTVEPIRTEQNRTRINKDKDTSPVPSEEVTEPVVITMPTNRFNTQGEEFLVTESMVAEWHQAYPSLNINAELPRIRAWLLDNQPKRKTVKGMRKFIGTWLSRQHDRGSQHEASNPSIQFAGQRCNQNSGRTLSAVDRVRERARAAGAG